jgi:hypothetical protein
MPTEIFLRRLEGEIDFKASIGPAVEGRVVLVSTSDEYKHVTELNFTDGSRHDRSEIGITHSGHVPADVRCATALLGLIGQNLPA